MDVASKWVNIEADCVAKAVTHGPLVVVQSVYKKQALVGMMTCPSEVLLVRHAAVAVDGCKDGMDIHNRLALAMVQSWFYFRFLSPARPISF